ncbi:Mor transcription activator family protein [Halomonas sp. MES3-P3E]|uniref:Mor transcription activator family protein n=1 Tax=Halomonas sp. MES3-P3E TaxID=2058321 RepID=UPI000C348598|nr:Mor transcription activator family protein [Halomonas sp. MES3-P3E]PKG50184.1 hypothetical protein CXF87_11940 [Halomonas sp. MES3-P3E]
MQLPPSVQQVADVIGRDQALSLVRQLRQRCSGKTLYVYVPKPDKLHVNHALVAMLGYADAVALCQQFGGMHLYPSPCKYLQRAIKNRVILALRDTGLNADEIAEQLGMSRKWVANVIDARDMVRRGDSIEVVARSVKISPLTLGYILDIDVQYAGPITSRGERRLPSPQMPLGL